MKNGWIKAIPHAEKAGTSEDVLQVVLVILGYDNRGQHVLVCVGGRALALIGRVICKRVVAVLVEGSLANTGTGFGEAGAEHGRHHKNVGGIYHARSAKIGNPSLILEPRVSEAGLSMND